MTINLEQWYRIPYYNGYEIYLSQFWACENSVKYRICNTPVYATVRSFKNFNKYPNGYILPYAHYNEKTKKTKYYYELTDLSNKRKRLTIQTILSIIENYDLDTVTDQEARNIGSRNRVRWNTDEKPIPAIRALSEEIVVHLSPKKETKYFPSFGPLIKEKEESKPKDAITFY